MIGQPKLRNKKYKSIVSTTRNWSNINWKHDFWKMVGDFALTAHHITACANGAWGSWAAGLLGNTQSFPALSFAALAVEGAEEAVVIEEADEGRWDSRAAPAGDSFKFFRMS